MAERSGGGSAGGEDEDKDDPATNNPLLDMFRRQARRPARGVGSGFIVDPKGYILTNQHVIQGATRITVRLQSGEEFRGVVKGIDEETDVAVIKIEAARDLPTVKLGNSDEAEVGDWVLAIGSPFGLDQTVTAGIISKKERQTATFTSFQQFLQTDAAINRGNSGRPARQHARRSHRHQLADRHLDRRLQRHRFRPAVERSRLRLSANRLGRAKSGAGIWASSSIPSGRVCARLWIAGQRKAQSSRTCAMHTGPAGKAGILANDIIIEFNGQPVTSSQDLINKVAGTPVGQTVTLTYLRDVNGKLERRTASVDHWRAPDLAGSARRRRAAAPPAERERQPEINACGSASRLRN